jgi:hypothetical protein
LPVYQTSLNYQISYRESEEEFITAGLQAALNQPGLSSFVSWFHMSFELYKIPEDLLGMISLYRLDHLLIEASGEQKTSLNDIIETTWQQLDFLNLSQREKEIFKRLGISNRYERDYQSIEGLYYDHQKMNVKPFLNRSFEYLFEDTLSQINTNSNGESSVSPNAESKSTFVYARLAAEAVQKRGLGVFDIHQELDSKLKACYTKLLKSEYQSARELKILAIQQYQHDRSAQKIMNLEIDLALSFAPQSSYISDYENSNLIGFIKNFMTSTGGYYQLQSNHAGRD